MRPDTGHRTDDVTVHLTPEALARTLRSEVVDGLTGQPKELSPKWLYDDRGCDLFEEITQLDEYYPTRTERAILEAHSAEIVELSAADTLIELGSGTSEKTRLLLDAMADAATLKRIVAFDVAEATLCDAVAELSAEYPTATVQGLVGDFNVHLGHLPAGGTRMIVFLGGTIGNLHPRERAQFLSSVADTLEPGDSLLVGTDVVKDRGRLVAAYDDASGVTAEFNKNVLSVLNRELDADFDVDAFDHVARFDEDGSFIEMRLRSRTAQQVVIDEIDLTVDFDEGEELRTEISTKFEPGAFGRELIDAGLGDVRSFSDESEDFTVWLARR